MQRSAIGIVGTGSYVPTSRLDNTTLAGNLGVDATWIVRKTGIHERRIAAPHEATSDLATHAAERALQHAQVRAEEIDLIVVATSSPDWIQPATACAVQAKLGAMHAAAFDLSAVCTGFVYALNVVWSMMQGSRSIRYALVIGAETYSRILNYEDRKTCVLFGDGAGAVVLGQVPETVGVLSSVLGADGSKADWVQIPAGGSRKPASVATLEANEHFFQMDGQSVRQFVEEMFPKVVHEALDQADLGLDAVDMIIPHQANGVMLRTCFEGLGLDDARVHYTFQQYGNTGGASVAITLDDAVRAGRVGYGDTLLLVAFGGGMTWGSMALRWAIADRSTPAEGMEQYHHPYHVADLPPCISPAG